MIAVAIAANVERHLPRFFGASAISAPRTRSSSFSAVPSTFGNSRSRLLHRVDHRRSAMTSRANHLLSAGTTYHGASARARVPHRLLVGVPCSRPSACAPRRRPSRTSSSSPDRRAARGSARAAPPSRRGGRTSGQRCRCAPRCRSKLRMASKRSSQMIRADTSGQPLALQELRMHAHDQHLLVVASD